MAERADFLCEWLQEAGCHTFVVCGGGEPLEEPEFITAAIKRCAAAGMEFEIYTSGTSVAKPIDIREAIRHWNAVWCRHRTSAGSPKIRLSVDAFHEDKIGLAPVIEWIRTVEEVAPEWSIALRGVRLAGDGSLARLAAALNARLTPVHVGLARLILPSGRELKAELKGLVLDGRASVRMLQARGLSLIPDDERVITELTQALGRAARLGRPLSARLTVTSRRIDVEIHSNGDVHVLESQPPDTLLNLFDFSWVQIRNVYYRDPLLHRVVGWGLPAVAQLIQKAVALGVAPMSVVPYSLDLLDHKLTLDVVSGLAVVLNSPKFSYSDDIIKMAQAFLAPYASAAA